jgi:membrane protein implicated in regulation of membrane protease activity
MPDIISIVAVGRATAAGTLPLIAAGSFGLFHTYLVFLILGLLYALFAFFTSSMGGDHSLDTGHDVDVGHDLDVGHDIDVDHDLDVGHDVGEGAETGELAVADGSMTHLGPFSPMIIAMFFTCFGLSGAILTKPIPLGWLSILPSLAIGVAGSWASMSAYNKRLAATEASSDAQVWRLVGREAQVITPIPENGVGEIQYVARGSTYAAPARSTDKGTIARGTKVTIVDASKTIFSVRKSIEERFRDLERNE